MKRKNLSGLDVTVIGGGFGGLSAACYLAFDGADVRIVEKNDEMGGRASTLELGGYRFDMGPSWYLMPDVFDRFFGHFNKKRSDFYELEHLDPHYRIYFKDGDSVDVPADVREAKRIFESYEPGSGRELERYLSQSKSNYRTAMDDFVYTDRSRLRDWIDTDVVKAMPVGMKLLKTMDEHVKEYFDSPKLQQIMQYTLVFLGGSPGKTPALYNMMSHVDFNLGVHYPEGGMTGVADSIARLAENMGVELRTGREVESIRPRGDGMVVETDERRIESDVVVSDADYHHTEKQLLDSDDRSYGDGYWSDRTLAPSAFLIYLGIEGDLPESSHHNLVLPTDWSSHFESIFDDPRWPEDPAYYVCDASTTDDSLAPSNDTALFILVPIAPGLDDRGEIRERFRNKVVEDLERNMDVEIEDRIEVEEIFSVSEFSERYNSLQGTALGLAHTLKQTALFRPSHRSQKLGRLYYTGGYTNPGIGVPMCLVSGEHTSDKIKEDVRRV